MSSLSTSTCSIAVTVMWGAARRRPPPERPPRRCCPRNRYADWSSSGFSRSSLGHPRELDPAALHDVGAVGQPERERRELLDQQHAGPGLGDRPDRRDEPVDDHRGEAERQLVDDHEPRVRHERLGEHDHLLLAARQRPGGVVEPLLELGEQLQRALVAGVGIAAGAACKWRREGSRPRSAPGAAVDPPGRSRARPRGSAPGACRRSRGSSSITLPAAGFSTPPIASTMLDLPAPLGPSSAVISPEGISSETPRTTLRPPRATTKSSTRSSSPGVVIRPPRSPGRRGSRARRGAPRRSDPDAIILPKSSTAVTSQHADTRLMSWSTRIVIAPVCSGILRITSPMWPVSSSGSPAAGSSSRTSRGRPDDRSGELDQAALGRAERADAGGRIDVHADERDRVEHILAARRRRSSWSARDHRHVVEHRQLLDRLLGLEGPAHPPAGPAEVSDRQQVVAERATRSPRPA